MPCPHRAARRGCAPGLANAPTTPKTVLVACAYVVRRSGTDYGRCSPWCSPALPGSMTVRRFAAAPSGLVEEILTGNPAPGLARPATLVSAQGPAAAAAGASGLTGRGPARRHRPFMGRPAVLTTSRALRGPVEGRPTSNRTRAAVRATSRPFDASYGRPERGDARMGGALAALRPLGRAWVTSFPV